jgi:hypothetical protein
MASVLWGSNKAVGTTMELSGDKIVARVSQQSTVMHIFRLLFFFFGETNREEGGISNILTNFILSCY